MNIKIENYKDGTKKAIENINSLVDNAREWDFSTEQVNAMNTGNIVTMLGTIALILAAIADKLEEV